MSAQRFCGECGAPTVPGKKFCTSCGAPVVAPVTTEQPPVAAAPLVTPPPSGPDTAGGRRRLVIIGTGVLALVAIALIAAFAAFGGSSSTSGTPSTSTWPRKDVNDFHRTCRTTGTSDFTCGQELTCAQAHVQSATYEHYYEDRNTADGKQLSHCLQSIPHRARFTKTCLNSWNSWVQASGLGPQIAASAPTASLAAIGPSPTSQSCVALFTTAGAVLMFADSGSGNGTWTLVSNRARNPGEKQDEANVVLNNDGTMTAIPPAVGTQSAAQDAATPEQQHCVDQWNVAGMGTYWKGKATVTANPCLIVAFTLLPDESIDGVFPCAATGVSYTCPEHGDDPNYAKQTHPEWLKTNAHFVGQGKLALDHPPSGGSGQGTTAPDLPTDGGYLIPVQGDGSLYPGITVSQVISDPAQCSLGSESAAAPAMRCFAGNYVIDPCFTNPQPPVRGETAYCPTAAGVKTVVQITIKRVTQ